MQCPVRTVSLVVAAVVLLTGCSTSTLFRLVLTVRDADDGVPLEWVAVTLDYRGAEEYRDDIEYGNWRRVVTDEGRLTHEFWVPDGATTQSAWLLKLRKDGYEPKVVAVKPPPKPPHSRDPTPLAVTVALKRLDIVGPLPPRR